jgi:hypothetical protein
LAADTQISFNYTSAYVSNFPAKYSPRYLERTQKMDSYSQVLMTMILALSRRDLPRGLLLPNLRVVVVVVYAATFLVVDTRRTLHKHH